MLKTKLITKTVNDKYIDLDGRYTYYDYNVKRIANFIYKAEVQKYDTIIETYGLKHFSIMQLKQKLNLKKKAYIDELRVVLEEVRCENPLNLYSKQPFNEHITIMNKIKELKLIKKNDDVGYFVVLAFYNKIKDLNIFTKLISINSDINKLEGMVKSYKEYYHDLMINNPKIYKNPKAKITKFDLDMLEKNKVTSNIKTIMYFYFNNIKIDKRKKGDMKSKMCLGTVAQEDIEELLEYNFKLNYNKNLDRLYKRSEIFQGQIINRYL